MPSAPHRAACDEVGVACASRPPVADRAPPVGVTSWRKITSASSDRSSATSAVCCGLSNITLAETTRSRGAVAAAAGTRRLAERRGQHPRREPDRRRRRPRPTSTRARKQIAATADEQGGEDEPEHERVGEQLDVDARRTPRAGPRRARAARGRRPTRGPAGRVRPSVPTLALRCRRRGPRHQNRNVFQFRGPGGNLDLPVKKKPVGGAGEIQLNDVLGVWVKVPTGGDPHGGSPRTSGSQPEADRVRFSGRR